MTPKTRLRWLGALWALAAFGLPLAGIWWAADLLG